GRTSAWFTVDGLDDAAAYAVVVGRHADIYVGAGLRRRDHGPHARGGAADVIAIPGVWADIDTQKPGATKGYFASREAADQFLDGLPIAPTLRVWTGRGYHSWWSFKEPWVFTDD